VAHATRAHALLVEARAHLSARPQKKSKAQEQQSPELQAVTASTFPPDVIREAPVISVCVCVRERERERERQKERERERERELYNCQ
jgi:hypothetical protein